jgi:penicillin-binding protein 2
MSINGNASDKVLIAGYVVIALFFVLIIRLWQLQILQGNEYRKLSEENRLRVVKVAAPRGIIYDRNGIPLVKNTPYYSVSLNPQVLERVDLAALAELLKVDRDSLAERVKEYAGRSLYEPLKLKEGLSTKEIALIEARRSDFPGLSIDVDVTREYLFGSVGSHLIGYLGKPNEFQAQSPDFKDVPSDAFIGQWGVERLYDKQLRGTPGGKVIEVDALGRELRLLEGRSPMRGNDVWLAMDIQVQKEAEDAFGDKTGAMVAIKPDTGELVVLISKPSFDPNMFARGIKKKQWEELNQNRRLPLLNRALQSQYPPGSTFKIVTAVAGLEEGAIDEHARVTCNGGISYGKWHFGCWRKTGHGTVSLQRALVESCDVYFYDVGRKLGIDKIAVYARELGLGNGSGLQLVKERRGLVPDTKWKEGTRHQQWYLGETFNASIGQGYVATTPFQMAQLTSTFANGGYVYRPSLLKMADKPVPEGKVKIKQETLDTVKRGLCGVVNESGGTGYAAKSSLVSICGKTGTAQVVGLRKESKYLPEMQRDHAWFVAFAPAETPEIALSVMVEHGGHGGAAAAPIAKKAIEAYIKSTRRAGVAPPAAADHGRGEDRSGEDRQKTD